MKMIVTRKTMISRQGATPSGAAGGARCILAGRGTLDCAGPRAFCDLSLPATIDSATLAFFVVFPSP